MLAAMADGLTNDGIASATVVRPKDGRGRCRFGLSQVGSTGDDVENRRVMAVKIFLTESSPSSGMLPSPPSAFVGRTEELAQLEDVVRIHRVVTIAGPGGMGKTRPLSNLVDAGSSKACLSDSSTLPWRATPPCSKRSSTHSGSCCEIERRPSTVGADTARPAISADR